MLSAEIQPAALAASAHVETKKEENDLDDDIGEANAHAVENRLEKRGCSI